MAQLFLDQLPKIRHGELPTGAICMICQEEYGTVPSDNGVIEHAVRLPCLHHVGSECIAAWLSPETRIGNSCPMCRTVFFPAQLAAYDDEDDDEDHESENNDVSDEDDDDEHDDDDDDGENEEDEAGEDGDEPEEAEDRTNGREQTQMTLLAAYQNAMSPPLDTSTRQNEGERWFERWPLPTSQQIKDSQERARRALMRPPPSGFMSRSLAQTYSPPTDFESKAAELASAYRTMAFRETLLYLNLKEAGARIPFLQSPHRGLSAHQEEVLLWELGQRGAFRGRRFRPGHMAMTNRELWYVHRSKGEVYTYEIPPAGGRGYWATDLGPQLDD
ncbi:MAG: hypothetical protein Q9161_008941 [Pseudevernia consocians]